MFFAEDIEVRILINLIDKRLEELADDKEDI